MKVQKTQALLSLESTNDNIPVLLIPFIVPLITVKTNWFLLQQKIIKYYWLIITFPVENDNAKQETIGSTK